jgi:hypothetical protein
MITAKPLPKAEELLYSPSYVFVIEEKMVPAKTPIITRTPHMIIPKIARNFAHRTASDKWALEL